VHALRLGSGEIKKVKLNRADILATVNCTEDLDLREISFVGTEYYETGRTWENIYRQRFTGITAPSELPLDNRVRSALRDVNGNLNYLTREGLKDLLLNRSWARDNRSSPGSSAFSNNI
jgi:hypothetical protein